MIDSKESFMSVVDERYAVLNYKGKFGDVSFVTEKSLYDANRKISNSFGDFMTEAYELMKQKQQVKSDNSNNEFDKSKFKSFMLVETRNKKKYIVNVFNSEIYFIGENGFHNANIFYREDLTYSLNKDFDIVKIYELKNTYNGSSYDSLFAETSKYFNLIWERKEKIKLTKQQIAEKFNIDIDLIEIV